MTDRKLIEEFCLSVKRGFGTIPDMIVKKEFERVYETQIDPVSLATLLALLEKHSLLDQRVSVNNNGFYQEMYRKMKSLRS